MTLDASIVVPSFRGAMRLPRLFAALERQTNTSYECIVAIDGDLDGSAAVVQAWRDRIPVRAVVFEENRGRSAALNAGHEAAHGTVLIRCDDDLRPPPQFIAEHVATHEGRSVGAVGMCLDVFEDTAFALAYGRTARDSMRQLTYSMPEQGIWRRWGANVSITQDLWSQIGPYDLRFTQYGWEDIDYGYRLHLAGVPVVLRPELEVEHLNPAPTASLRASKAFASGESRAVFSEKHGSGVLSDSAPTGSPWNVAVRTVAGTMRSQRAVDRWGTPADYAVNHLPPKAGRKVAALLIEAAGAASLH